jgi:hypothetical protein
MRADDCGVVLRSSYESLRMSGKAGALTLIAATVYR